MVRSSHRSRGLAQLVLGLVVVVGCTQGGGDGDDGDAAEGDVTAEETVPVPESRLTPFCQGMIDLADRLETDPSIDVEAEILETYEALADADEVPDVLQPDFEVVLAELRGEPVPTVDPADTVDTSTSTSSTTPIVPPATDETGATIPSGDPFFDEGRLPGETPSERISAYVDFECRASQNNPGPPATEPLEPIPTSEP